MAIKLGYGVEPSPGLQRDEEPGRLRAVDVFLTESTLSGKEFHISLLLSEKLYLGYFPAGVVFSNWVFSSLFQYRVKLNE